MIESKWQRISEGIATDKPCEKKTGITLHSFSLSSPSRLLNAFPVLQQILSKLEIERMPCTDSVLKAPVELTLKKKEEFLQYQSFSEYCLFPQKLLQSGISTRDLSILPVGILLMISWSLFIISIIFIIIVQFQLTLANYMYAENSGLAYM